MCCLESAEKLNPMNQTLELAPAEKTAVALRPSELPVARDPEGLLKFAIEKGASVETLERLMVVRTQLRAEQAKEAFDASMKAFQSECPVITKDTGVPDRTGKTAYKYSPIEAIEIQIKPFELKFGFHHNFPDTLVEPGWMTAFCKITHDAGHSELAKVKYPIGTKTAIMSDTQQYAAAETFCKRRCLCNAYGITLAGEDRDGATGKIKPKGPSSMAPTEAEVRELAKVLWEMLKPVRGTEKNWNAANQWLWREDILDGAVPEAAPDLTAARFREVIKAVKERLK